MKRFSLFGVVMLGMLLAAACSKQNAPETGNTGASVEKRFSEDQPPVQKTNASPDSQAPPAPAQEAVEPVATQAAEPQEPPIKKGDRGTVLNSETYTVKNPEPVQVINATLEFGSACTVKSGGIVEVLGVRGEEVLALYAVDGKAEAAERGSEKSDVDCPAGKKVVLAIPLADFRPMHEEYVKVETEKQAVRDLLKE